MRLYVLLAATLLGGCSPPPAPAPVVKRDPTVEPWYGQTVAQLAQMNASADKLWESGKRDQAGAVVSQAQPLEARLLAAPHPTLAATEAASDLDELYGRMLLTNRHYGWARLMFQKNVIRWKTWKPQTPETLRRLQLAQSAIVECDRQLTAPQP